MQRVQIALFVGITVFGGRTLASADMNPDCTFSGNERICPLAPGTHSYATDAESLRLENNGTQWIQINEVQAAVGTPGVWAEMAVYLDRFQLDQDVPGRGEVGAIHANANEVFGQLKWTDGQGYGLSVPPGSFIQLNVGQAHPPTLFVVKAAVQTAGVHAVRQPKADHVFTCSGSQQATVWDAWQNTGSTNWSVAGATIFASGGDTTPNSVQSACVYIMSSNGQDVIWSYCGDGVRTRGRVTFPAVQTVAPGQYLAAQAVHTCSSALWGWAAYIWKW